MGEFLIFLLVLFLMFAIPICLVIAYDNASTETQAKVDVSQSIGLNILKYIVIGILSGGIRLIFIPFLILFDNK